MTEQEVASIGRPTSYRPEYAKHAQALCKLGATDAELADFFGVHIRTIGNWKVSQEDFLQALKLGKETADERVVNSLYHKAIGYSFDAEKIFQYEGEPVRVEYREHVPPDTTAAIFWLKNRDPERWRDKTEHDTKIELTLRFERAPEQWRLIESEVSPALESQIERQPQVVQDTMRLVLEGVPASHQQEVYDHAISTALAAATRGDGELPDKDLAEKADVAEAAPGFWSNLDAETEEERARFEDALAAVQAHNATVRARKT